jgi:hypothetical protein
MSACVYCGRPATRLDLCHASHPVCDDHPGIGHQAAPLPQPRKEARGKR